MLFVPNSFPKMFPSNKKTPSTNSHPSIPVLKADHIPSQEL